VSDTDRPLWEAYANDNQDKLLSKFSENYFSSHDDRHHRELKLEGEHEHDDLEQSPYRMVDWTVDQGMYRIENTIAISDDSTGVYAPNWQSAPYSVTNPTAMFNQMSESFRKVAIETLVELKSPYFAQNQLEGTDSSLLVNHESPTAALYSPIFEHVEEHEGSFEAAVVGALTFDINWASFWSHSVSEIAAPITVILENRGCNQTYTYQVSNSDVEFVSEGEIFYENSLDLVVESSYDRFMELLGHDDIQMNCSCYRVRVYPTQDFEEHYVTNLPTLSSIGVAFIFILTAAVFIGYDCLVQRRQAQLMRSAKRSNAIVR
jgi:hypothetical protein